MSIKADVEWVVCLPNILQFAFPALDEINNVTHFVDRCCFYVVGTASVSAHKNILGLDVFNKGELNFPQPTALGDANSPLLTPPK